MTVIIDYGVGNLFSLTSSLRAIGQEATVTSDRAVIESAQRIILPGVGAFADAVGKLYSSGLSEVILREAERGKPIMGICLGMQLLFEESYENGRYRGLGLIDGAVVPIADVVPDGYKIPHIGWNALTLKNPSAHMKSTKNGDFVYFVHSYYAKTSPENIVAVTEYGAELTAAVKKGNVCGCQFHPEKSGEAGLSILNDFCQMKG